MNIKGALTEFRKIEANRGFFGDGIENSQIGGNNENMPETGTTQGSGSIARLSIPAFRVGDPGPNPGRSTND